MARIEIIGGNFSYNGRAGISVSENADVRIENVIAEGNGGPGIEIRDAPTLLARLGLPPTAPIGEVLAVLKTIKETPAMDADKAREVVSNSGLVKYIPVVANWATIGSLFLQVATLWTGTGG